MPGLRPLLSGLTLDLFQFASKGHLFVELDAVVLAGGGRIVARIDHTAIYEPRQVRA